MMWFVIIIGIVIVLYFLMNNSEQKNIGSPRTVRNKATKKEVLAKEFSKMLFQGRNSEKEIYYLSTNIFEYSLSISNKEISIEEVTDNNKIMQNPELLHYVSIFGSIKDTLTSFANNPILQTIPVNNQNQTSKDSINNLIDGVVLEINKI